MTTEKKEKSELDVEKRNERYKIVCECVDDIKIRVLLKSLKFLTYILGYTVHKIINY